MKAKSIVFLLCLMLSFSLRATLPYKYTPIYDGKFYFTTNTETGKSGILKEQIDEGYLNYAEEDEKTEYLKSLIIVPVAYDDIMQVPVVFDGGQQVNRFYFGAIKEGKYTLYSDTGRKLTEPMSQRFGWYAGASGTLFSFVSLLREDGQSVDLHILLEWPNLGYTIPGPFGVSWFESVKIGDKNFYYIKNNAAGATAKYDVFGTRIPEDKFQRLDQWYSNLSDELGNYADRELKKDNTSKAVEQAIYKAAYLGNPTILGYVVEQFYTLKQHERVREYAMGPGWAYENPDALFYAAQCERLGLGCPVNISLAEFWYKKALEFAKKNPSSIVEASAKLCLDAIAKIEEPIKIKTGTPPSYDVTDNDEVKRMAQEGWLEAIETYCHRSTFFTFGCALEYEYDDDEIVTVANDKTSAELLPLLLGAAPYNAYCQFMLACIYAGDEAVGLPRNFGYSFRKPDKAKYWVEKFAANPRRSEASCWGLEKDQVEWIIENIREME